MIEDSYEHTPPIISKLTNTSGNTFHAEVSRWLKDREWHVTVSPYYMDQTQNKAREIDLIAEKLYTIPNMYYTDRITGYLAVRLFIECKYTNVHSAFWFAEKDKDSARNLVCNNGIFHPNHKYTSEHHYLDQDKNQVAKLFASEGKSEPFYKALNQVLNAMVAMREKTISAPLAIKSGKSLKNIFQFPIVICSSFDKLYAVDFYSKSPQSNIITDNFQMEVQYAYIDTRGKHKDDYFLLDLIDYNQLEQFIKSIDVDMRNAVDIVSNRE